VLKGKSKGVVGENIREAKSKGLSERDAVLVSMKKSKAEVKKEKSGSCCGPIGYDSDAYPYGLRLDINDDSLDKLGMDDLPKVGKTVKIVAEAEVQSASESTSASGKSHRSVGLQITKMKVG
jgi:hypothetical protein